MQAGKRDILLPAITVARQWPANIAPDDKILFHHEMTRRFPPVTLRTVRTAKVIPNIAVCRWSGMIGEAFARPIGWRTRLRGAIEWWRNNPKRSKLDEFFWITDDWSCWYFHWLCDVLPKLYVISMKFKGSNILLSEEYKKLEFAEQSLQVFNDVHISYVADKEATTVPYLRLISPIAPTGNFNEEIIHGIRFKLLNALRANNPYDASQKIYEKWVYISRAKSSRRRIVNEVAVLDTIKIFGYQITYMEDLPFWDQLELMQHSKILIGLHGAGLTNMLFMPTSSVVIEIRIEQNRRNSFINNCYFALASAMRHKYYYLIARPLPDEGSNGSGDVVVDIKALSRVLRQVASDCIHDKLGRRRARWGGARQEVSDRSSGRA
jgi:capsular polysaccharide biosynthesis protein